MTSLLWVGQLAPLDLDLDGAEPEPIVLEDSDILPLSPEEARRVFAEYAACW